MRRFIERCFIDKYYACISMEYSAQILKILHQKLLFMSPELHIGTKCKAPFSLEKLHF